jgi:tetratricopeptide (TPR) repeat protein
VRDFRDRQQLATFEGAWGSEHYDVAINLNNLAALLYQKGQLAEAETLYQRALTLKQKLLGRDHPDVGVTMQNLAVLCAATGRVEAAMALYHRALAVFKATLGPRHPSLITCADNLAVLQRRRAGARGVTSSED